jgi:polyribonucleotide nucleotidyltransferase
MNLKDDFGAGFRFSPERLVVLSMFRRAETVPDFEPGLHMGCRGRCRHIGMIARSSTRRAARHSGRMERQTMFDHHKVELNWGGQPLTLETGKIARQADGAVLATLGETVVLATVVSAKTPKAGIDFFPLTVNYQEKYFAAGKIPGGYFKREGRPTEAETLISRLIDRPIRPLFPDGYKNETQVIVTVLQHDMENNPDILSLVAASAALTISGVPFMGPIGAARVGYVDGEYVLNLAVDRRDDSKLDLVIAGTADAVLMVESDA